jgi:hypothetical protein
LASRRGSIVAYNNPYGSPRSTGTTSRTSTSSRTKIVKRYAL